MLTHERKFLAALIDVALVLVIALIIFLFLPNVNYGKTLLFVLIDAIVAFSYFFSYLSITKNSTLGLKIMNLKVLNIDWSKPTRKSILLRSVSYTIPVFYLLNIFYLFLNRSETTLFDELSESFVAPVGDIYNISKK